jgi:hypothetical protein
MTMANLADRLEEESSGYLTAIQEYDDRLGQMCWADDAPENVFCVNHCTRTPGTCALGLCDFHCDLVH